MGTITHENAVELAKWTAIIMGIIGVYFMPWMIAGWRNTKNRHWVAIINAFFGFTLLGWFVALALATSGKKISE